MQESTYAQRVTPSRLHEDPPNIVVILIDDAGPGLPTTLGGEVRTATMDRICAEGVSYNRFHTTAMCSPTRASLLTGRPVRNDLAMTGEITLRGKVLPVGGIKEKVLAARRAGITTVILPRRNESDLEDIPPEVRSELETIFVDTVDEVLKHALRDPVIEPMVSEVALKGPEALEKEPKAA